MFRAITFLQPICQPIKVWWEIDLITCAWIHFFNETKKFMTHSARFLPAVTTRKFTKQHTERNITCKYVNIYLKLDLFTSNVQNANMKISVIRTKSFWSAHMNAPCARMFLMECQIRAPPLLRNRVFNGVFSWIDTVKYTAYSSIVSHFSSV